MSEKIENRKPADHVLINFIKTFFQSNINLWILIPITISVLIISIYYSSAKSHWIYPNDNEIEYSFFNDNGSGGHSEIYDTIKSDSLIQLNFHLKKGFINPYVGLHVEHKNNAYISVNSCNQVTIDIYSEGLENIGLYLNSQYESNDSLHELRFFHSIKIGDGRNIHTIKLNELKIPDWFLDANNINDKVDSKPDMNRLNYFNITSAYPAKANDNGTIRVYSVLFDRNNTKLNIVLLAVLLSVILILLIIHAVKLKLNQKTNTVTIAYKSVEIKESNAASENYLSFINSNFDNPELTLELVSRQTGIGQRNIAHEIQETFDCNFKTYINQIRINESKRLLKETNLNIGEIAYKVGFNNQSHFNRVFKSLTNSSPTTYRS